MYLLKKDIHTTTIKTNRRFTSLIAKLINTIRTVIVATFLGIKWIQHGVFLHEQFASVRVFYFSLMVEKKCCSIDYIECMQFGFRFQILLFSTSVRFSTKTLAYLAYKAYKAFKAFMAFKRSRLNPFQNYRSITSFSVDWPRTIRFVYASVSILERIESRTHESHESLECLVCLEYPSSRLEKKPTINSWTRHALCD